MFLTARWLPTVADNRLIAFGQWFDEFVRERLLRGGFDFFCRRAEFAVRDVVEHGIVEQHRLLSDDADLFPQATQIRLAQVDSVDQHKPVIGVVKSRQQPEECRLPASVRPDERNRLTGLDVQADRGERWQLGTGRIRERDVAKLDRFAVFRQHGAIGVRRDRGNFVVQFEDAICRDGSSLDFGVHARQFPHGVCDGHQEHVELQQRRERQEIVAAHVQTEDSPLLFDDEIRTGSESEADCRNAEEFDHRPRKGVDVRHLLRFASIFIGSFAKSPAFVRFHRECLHDSDSIEGLADDLVNIRHAFEQFASRTAHHPAHFRQRN